MPAPVLVQVAKVADIGQPSARQDGWRGKESVLLLTLSDGASRFSALDATGCFAARPALGSKLLFETRFAGDCGLVLNVHEARQLGGRVEGLRGGNAGEGFVRNEKSDAPQFTALPKEVLQQPMPEVKMAAPSERGGRGKGGGKGGGRCERGSGGNVKVEEGRNRGRGGGGRRGKGGGQGKTGGGGGGRGGRGGGRGGRGDRKPKPSDGPAK